MIADVELQPGRGGVGPAFISLPHCWKILKKRPVPLGLVLKLIHHKLAQTDKAVQQTIAQQNPCYLLLLYSSSIQNFRHQTFFAFLNRNIQAAVLRSGVTGNLPPPPKFGPPGQIFWENLRNSHLYKLFRVFSLKLTHYELTRDGFGMTELQHIIITLSFKFLARVLTIFQET